VKQIIRDYDAIVETPPFDARSCNGDSSAPKELVFHVFDDLEADVKVLDVGFGFGNLGRLIHSNPKTSHWLIDGVDGWEPNCFNEELISKRIYRNIWHGMAEDLGAERLAEYDLICVLDVVEHLSAENAKWLIRTLLHGLGPRARLFISTPLWVYPQGHVVPGDLEEHQIGVPVTSMLALMPVCYSINHPLIGGFVYGRESLPYVDLFQPSANRSFSFQMGLNLLQSVNLPYRPGVLYKTGFFSQEKPLAPAAV